MSRLSGHTGNVVAGIATIDNCEDVWNEQVDGDVTASLDTSDYQSGSGSAKFVCAAGLANGDIIASEVVSVDLSTYTVVLAKLKSSVEIATEGDLALLLDEQAMCASPLALDIPTLVANTWKTCRMAADLSDYNATISVGLKLVANDPGAFNLWIDHIMAGKTISGIKSWSIDYVKEILNGRAFDDAGAPHPVVGGYNWSGSFEGYKDGAPLGIGDEVFLEFQESTTVTQMWRGLAIISAVHPQTSHDQLVAYSYDFVGKGILEVPTT